MGARSSPQKIRLVALANLSLLLGAVCAPLIVAEAILQIFDSNTTLRYGIWPPGIVQEIRPDGETPGIRPIPHQFKTTSAGYRGDLDRGATIRIAAFGGSTTESLFVAEERSWPRLLEQELSKRLSTTAWVGNFGKSGRNTRQHVLDARYVLPQFSAQLALFLIGVNDLAIRVNDPAAQSMSLDEIRAEAYMRRSLIINDEADSTTLKLVQLIRKAREKHNVKSDHPGLSHVTTDFYRRERRLRAERVGLSSSMPELNAFLDEYARNVTAIVDTVRAQGKVPILISQPSLWSASAAPEIEALFWWGAVDGWPVKSSGGYYYSSETLDRMLEAYNSRLRLVASERNFLLIDAAKKLPKSARFFYDQVHFNEAGSQALAELIADELATYLQQPQKR